MTMVWTSGDDASTAAMVASLSCRSCGSSAGLAPHIQLRGSVALLAGLIDMTVMARLSKLPGMLKSTNAVTGEVVGGVGDKEHVEGLHGVELHGDELGMMAKWLAVGGLGETGSVRKYKRSQKCKRVGNLTCRRVPLHKEPLLPQI